MKSFESHECAAEILESARGMGIRFPFDECWRDTVEGQGPVCGNGNLPIQRPTAHCFNIAQGNRRRRGRSVNVIGSADPGGQPRCRVRAFLIELEPARAIRIPGSGVDGNDFKIQGISESQQTIVSPHARMLTSGLRRHAKSAAHVRHADRKRRRREDYVVDMRT